MNEKNDGRPRRADPAIRPIPGENIEREHRRERRLIVITILTLVMGIAAMSIDYLWNISRGELLMESGSAPPAAPDSQPCEFENPVTAKGAGRKYR